MSGHNWYTAKDIALKVKGHLIGDGAIRVKGVCPIDHPEPDCLSFIKGTSTKKILAALEGSSVPVLLVPNGVKEFNVAFKHRALIAVNDPLAALVDISPLFFSSPNFGTGISPLAQVDPTASIGNDVTIGAFSCVGPGAQLADNVTVFPHVTIYPNAKIGRGCVIHSGAVIREHCLVGESTVIHNGAVIGADGFGFIPDPELKLKKVPQIGNVIIGSQVEIGANTCIDRATLGSTTIGQGTKIDNLVQVGHNVKIGMYSIVCGQAGIAGSCEIGDGVVIGGNAGIADHIKIASGCRIAAKAGVINDLTEKGDYAGHPAIKASAWMRQAALMQRTLKANRVTANTAEGNSVKEERAKSKKQ